MTLQALIQKMKDAGGPSVSLDREIFEAVHGISSTHKVQGYSGGIVERAISGLPEYTRSIDAALSLYKTKPALVPSNALAACIEALEQW